MVVVELEPLRQDRHFEIATARGRVTAVGTMFAVQAAPGHAAARVGHGTVIVHTSDGATPVQAGHALTIGQAHARLYRDRRSTA